MTRFRYRMRLADGRYRDGEVEAADRISAARQLANQDGTIVRLFPQGRSLWALLNQDIGGADGVSAQSRLSVLKDLATLLQAELSVDQALSLIQETAPNARARRSIARAAEAVRAGQSLSDALADSGLRLGDAEIALLKAGEASGHLAQVAGDIAVYLERRAKLRADLIGALIYPLLLLIVCLGTMVLLVTMVIPQFEPVFQSAGAALPPITQSVRTLSAWLLNNGIWLLLLIIALAGAVWAYGRTNDGRLLLGRWMMRLPWLGALYGDQVLARFASAATSLLQGGVRLDQALRIAADAQPNAWVRDQLIQVHARMLSGAPLGRTLQEAGTLPPSAVRLIRVGEESNRLPQMFAELARLAEARLEQRTKILMGLLTPVVTVIMGGAVGVIIWSIMAAVLSVGDVLQ